MDRSPSPPSVAVCIATCRRPAGLDRLLAALAGQTFPGPGPAPRVRVIVVDNDPAAGLAEPVIARWRTALDDLSLEREPRRGISFARNRALDAAGEVDFVAFIDDDEAPAPTWLAELLAVQAKHDADVVGGPVVPEFDQPPPAWLAAGGFFDRPRHPTGTELHVAYTHNVLVRWPPYRTMRFSPRYATSGGEDSHFFGRIHKAGGRIVWADDAVVHEWQSPERHTIGWHLRRHYRIGLTRAVIDAELGLSAHPRRTTARQAGVRIGGGLVQLVTAAGGGTDQRVRALTRMAAGFGRLAGLAGLWFEEYRADPS